MSHGSLIFQTEPDGIALLTVNRPDKLNALNAGTISELESAFEQFRADASIRGLILTGAGEKAFVAGADVNELAAVAPLEARELSARGQRIFRLFETSPKPSIAAINGFALGGGLELAMCCTMRVASSKAKLGQPEVKLGISPGYGGTQRLPRLVGRGRALEMLLSGDPVDAAEAHRIGLVNHVVPQAELLDFCRQLMRKLLGNAPVAASLIMEAVDLGLNSGIDEGLRFETTVFGLAAATDDRREGTRAFLEKRKPIFAGK